MIKNFVVHDDRIWPHAMLFHAVLFVEHAGSNAGSFDEPEL